LLAVAPGAAEAFRRLFIVILGTLLTGSVVTELVAK